MSAPDPSPPQTPPVLPFDGLIAPIDHSNPAVAHALHALHQAAYAQEAQLLGIAPERFAPLQRTVYDLQSANISCWAAFEGTELVGAVATCPDESDEASGGTAMCVASITVRPDQQRRGIGRQLLKTALDADPNCPWTVQIAALNSPALALCAEQGFATKRRWVEGGITLLALRRSRSAPGL
jgi:GNAT superfamily N-acetyltransferase